MVMACDAVKVSEALRSWSHIAAGLLPSFLSSDRNLVSLQTRKSCFETQITDLKIKMNFNGVFRMVLLTCC